MIDVSIHFIECFPSLQRFTQDALIENSAAAATGIPACCGFRESLTVFPRPGESAMHETFVRIVQSDFLTLWFNVAICN
jgi:hypothetical protein